MQNILFLYMQIIINTCDSSILYLTISMRTTHIQIHKCTQTKEVSKLIFLIKIRLNINRSILLD